MTPSAFDLAASRLYWGILATVAAMAIYRIPELPYWLGPGVWFWSIQLLHGIGHGLMLCCLLRGVALLRDKRKA